jgi:hypothetical protein
MGVKLDRFRVAVWGEAPKSPEERKVGSVPSYLYTKSLTSENPVTEEDRLLYPCTRSATDIYQIGC